MTSTVFVELNSTHRNRTIWQEPAEFQLPLMNSGVRASRDDAFDPISDAAPLFAWSSNYLTENATSNYTTATIDAFAATNLSTNNTAQLILQDNAQQLKNYYERLVLEMSFAGSPSYYQRILDSSYFGNNVNILVNFFLTLDDDGFLPTYSGQITDPTDFSDLSKPVIFIPNGVQVFTGSFNSLILYNETINEYRPIKNFDQLFNIATLDTTGTTTYSSGPLSADWTTSDNFSIRRAPPSIPLLGAKISTNSAPYIFPFVVATDGNTYTTSLSRIIISDPLQTMSSELNAYRNDFLRIMPFNSATIDRRYLYNPEPTNNQARRITGYFYVENATNLGTYCAVIDVVADFNTTLSNLTDNIGNDGATIEILPFTRDNFVPLSYSGTLISSPRCYDVSIQSITLPNQLLVSGGYVRDLPYIYVQVSNVSNPCRTSMSLYSNSPSSISAVFKCIVYDINKFERSPYVRLDSSGIISRIKFNPNDCLFVKVFLPDGTLFRTVLIENAAPFAPNPVNQISILLSLK